MKIGIGQNLSAKTAEIQKIRGQKQLNMCIFKIHQELENDAANGSLKVCTYTYCQYS